MLLIVVAAEPEPKIVHVTAVIFTFRQDVMVVAA